MSDTLFTIKGTSQLVMNNGEKADPDSEFVREMAEERASGGKKTPEGRLRINKIDWKGGLYYHHDENNPKKSLGPVIPDANIIKCIVQGAAPQKLGKVFDAYINVTEPFVRLDYEGPRDLEGMWEAHMYDRRLVSATGKPGGPKVIRVRPLFKAWSLKFTIQADEDVETNTLIDAVKFAGKRVGLCERTKFRWGRFEVASAKVL